MPRKSAIVTQADISRAIRAAQAEGLTVVRVVVRADHVTVETTPEPDAKKPADKERSIIL